MSDHSAIIAVRGSNLPKKLLISSIGMLALTGCRSKATEANFAKVQVGMTPSEVEAILGKPDESFNLQEFGIEEHWVAKAEKKEYIFVLFRDGKCLRMGIRPGY